MKTQVCRFNLRDIIEYFYGIYACLFHFPVCLFRFQADLVKKAFQAMRVFLVKASNTKLPSKVR